MHTPCELAVKIALPCIRAMLADQLMREHKLNQNETSAILGISQSAVSKYNQKHRGYSLSLENDPEIVFLVAKHANVLVNGNPSYVEKITLMCEICSTLRYRKHLCRVHSEIDPTYDTEKCNFCRNGACWKGFVQRVQQNTPQSKVVA